jgi:cytochrome b involved in lipid metabolism
MEYISREEVVLHNTVDDCWVIANNYVYNITPFLLENHFHVSMLSGREGTDISIHFNHHTWLQKKKWNQYIIGRVVGSNHCTCI